MGKGFNNYMCKKFFHPASADNLKRVWIATKKADAEKKKQDDLRSQYDREQELYNNKALLSKETKEKLELNFMYEPPPGVKKIGEQEEKEGEPEYKFEWQRTWGHAPKESYLQQGDDFNEQPFGIQVCQAKCIKCGKYGHMNTDRRCHLYGKAVDSEAPVQNLDQARLLEEMKADGLAMRWSAWDMNKTGPNHTMVQDTEEERKKPMDRMEVLKSMSKEEKKKLLKKLKKEEKKRRKQARKEKKKKMDNSDSSSEDDEEKDMKPSRMERNGRKSRSLSPRRDKRRESDDERNGNSKYEKRDRRDRSRSRDKKRDSSVNRNRRDRSGSRKRRDRSSSRNRRDGADRKNVRERSRSRDRRERSGSRNRRDRSRSRNRR